jgi:prophage regulatory protein
MHNALIRLNQLLPKIGLSHSTVWRLERQGLFPRHKLLGSRAIGWLEKDIDLWIESRATTTVAQHEGQ